MDKKLLLKECKENYLALRDILNEWDFLGALEFNVKAEYDCLIDPILKTLKHGTTEKKLSDFLAIHISDHFGVTPSGINEASRKILALRKLDTRKNR